MAILLFIERKTPRLELHKGPESAEAKLLSEIVCCISGSQ